MTLREYIEKTGLGYAGFGKLVGMSRGDLHNLAHGVRGFSVWSGLRIKAATKGKVTLDDLAKPFAAKARELEQDLAA